MAIGGASVRPTIVEPSGQERALGPKVEGQQVWSLVWSGNGAHPRTAIFLQPVSDAEVGVMSIVALDRRELAPEDRNAALEAFRPITHVSLPSIDLDADVVPASLVPLDGAMTLEVPAFKVGHAETTAANLFLNLLGSQGCK